MNLMPISGLSLVAIVIYGAFYGAFEAAGRARPPAPGSRWQVPSSWVRSVSPGRRLWVWGTLLGPGFATRNPYAGFAFLVLAVAAVGDLRQGAVIALMIGVAHAAGRAVALLRNVRLITAADYMNSLVKEIHWRMIDGYALLAIVGVASMVCIYRF